MSSTTTPKLVESRGTLPTGPEYAYHVAPVEDADEVLTDGLHPDRSPDTWNSFDRILERVANTESVTTKPANRADCTFAYTRREQGTDPTVHLSGYVTLVIDLTVVSVPLYAASYGKATGFHMEMVDAYPEWNAELGPEPDELDETVYAAAEEYWESVIEYDLETTPDTATELLIEGSVPPTAFTHILR